MSKYELNSRNENLQETFGSLEARLLNERNKLNYAIEQFGGQEELDRYEDEIEERKKRGETLSLSSAYKEISNREYEISKIAEDLQKVSNQLNVMRVNAEATEIRGKMKTRANSSNSYESERPKTSTEVRKEYDELRKMRELLNALHDGNDLFASDIEKLHRFAQTEKGANFIKDYCSKEYDATLKEAKSLLVEKANKILRKEPDRKQEILEKSKFYLSNIENPQEKEDRLKETLDSLYFKIMSDFEEELNTSRYTKKDLANDIESIAKSIQTFNLPNKNITQSLQNNMPNPNNLDDLLKNLPNKSSNRANAGNSNDNKSTTEKPSDTAKLVAEFFGNPTSKTKSSNEPQNEVSDGVAATESKQFVAELFKQPSNEPKVSDGVAATKSKQFVAGLFNESTEKTNGQQASSNALFNSVQQQPKEIPNNDDLLTTLLKSESKVTKGANLALNNMQHTTPDEVLSVQKRTRSHGFSEPSTDDRELSFADKATNRKNSSTPNITQK